MSQAFKSQHNRMEPRAVILPKEIRGQISYAGEDGNTIQQPFIIFDVSKKGVGIWAFEAIPTGVNAQISISYPYILNFIGETRWCTQSGEEGFRCGILATTQQAKLESLFDSFCKMAEKIVNPLPKQDSIP